MEFVGEWDEEGVYVYQAYCDEIADWALEHQRFGGPKFKPERMTWIKPSFAWMLYRAGYGLKHGQNRVLKMKLSHEAIAKILSNCNCGHGGGGTIGRVQWDPARDLLTAEGNHRGKFQPRKMLKARAIQIGMKGYLSKFYVDSVISIQEVTDLALEVRKMHFDLLSKSENTDHTQILTDLPVERLYLPKCSEETLDHLGILPNMNFEEFKEIDNQM